jgi:glycosyltransferase involved in cell wall biosynthesis
MADPLHLTVVIPTYGRDEPLVNTIRSVLAQDCRDFDLIVVDQTLKHDDATTKFLRATTDPRFHYVVVQPPSLPAARNYGIEKAKGDIVVFIDDDVTLAAGFLEAHRGAYEDLNVFGVAGRVTGPTDPPAQKLYRLNVLGRGVGSFNYHTAETAFSARAATCRFVERNS